jgi:CheY-like chemotaxis protein
MVFDLQRPASVSRDPGTPKLLLGVRVLVVEGEADARDLLDAVFAYCGALVSCASSAREAISQARALPPDVIVCDLALPGEDGYWLIRELRGLDGATGAVPAVALSAGREHVSERTLAAGFNAFMRKPIDPWELCGIIAGLARKA